MRLRVRHPNGANVLDNLDSVHTVADLRETIATLINVPQQRIQVAGGYPLKTLKNDNDTLQSAGIRNGDALTVTIVEAAAAAAVAVPERPQPAVANFPVTATTTTTTTTSSEEAVELSGGYLALRTVPDDNSCLFRSIGYVINRDTSSTQELRSVVAAAIEADPVSYSDATLGQKRENYINWIQKNGSWGGAIEISILSNYFSVEIDSVDVQTGRVDKFGEGNYEEKVVIVYSGIHYDAVALTPALDVPTEFDQTRFSADDETVVNAAKKLADGLRKKHKYTDVANFTLRCEQCKKGLVGEKDATEHATATGHTRFVEYSG